MFWLVSQIKNAQMLFEPAGHQVVLNACHLYWGRQQVFIWRYQSPAV